MITLDQFITKYSGKKIDWDGYYQGQCMDLYHQYVNECLGLEHPGAPSAYLLWNKLYKDYTKITNTPEAIPQKGDIMLWNNNTGGGHGHVAVYVSGDVNSFTSFDQNWRAINVCELTKHNYNHVIGWLHPKTKPSKTNMTISNITERYKVKDLKELDDKLWVHVGDTWGDTSDKENKSYLAEERRKSYKLAKEKKQLEIKLAECDKFKKALDKQTEANIEFAKNNEELIGALNVCETELANAMVEKKTDLSMYETKLLIKAILYKLLK